MVAWEYRVAQEHYHSEAELNLLGADGWELAVLVPGGAVFKRPIITVEPVADEPASRRKVQK